MSVVRRRKKPVEVDTIQWTGTNEHEVQEFTGGASTFYALDDEDRAGCDDPEATATVFDNLHCTWVLVYTGQHIVRGVKREYYPIAEDVLAETYELADTVPADGEAYDGELAMLRGLVRTLRVVARPDDADLGEIRRLLHHHAADDAAAREQGKSSHQADATPGSSREQRLTQLLDTLRTRPGKWTSRLVQDARRSTGAPAQRGTARRDLAELARRGYLQQHGAGDDRYYTLRRRKDND